MRRIFHRFYNFAAAAILVAGVLFVANRSAFAQQDAASAPSAKAIGAIKELNGPTITLTPDSGPAVSIMVQPSTQILRVEPGAKTLAEAAAITVQDLQVGDRIRVTGKMSDDGKSLLAAKIIAIKHADLEARHQQEIQDWQKRGVDGLATAVDPAAGTVTLTLRNKPVVVHASQTTVIRRYPPDSVKFDDAKVSTLQAIHPGDQVRARGTRSPDGAEFTAEELVSGAFRNVAGTINSIDAAASTLSVHDLLSRKNITIKIAPDSQLRKLPPEMAQRIAQRLKTSAIGASAAAAAGGSAPRAGPPSMSAPPAPVGAAPVGAPPARQWPGSPGAEGASSGPRGAPDLQQMLSRLPPAPLSDLHKGDAVVVVSTEGTASESTAITLLSGVEPILQAAPGARTASILSPWSLSAPGGDSGGP
jgi:hypothetical protein